MFCVLCFVGAHIHYVICDVKYIDRKIYIYVYVVQRRIEKHGCLFVAVWADAVERRSYYVIIASMSVCGASPYHLLLFV